jgi:hypothetical protein
VAAGGIGVDLYFDDTGTMHMKNLERTPANKPPMLQDIEVEKQTEINAISGGVLKYSFDDQEFPYTRLMYALMKAIDSSYTLWGNVAESWQHVDHSIWKLRGEPRHFVCSKVMCCSALHQGIIHETR